MITLRIKYADTTVNIQFPCTDNLLMAKLMELHATDHEGDPFFVEEVIEPRDLAPFFETQFVDLDEVNYLAKRMESFMDKEINQFFAASTLEGHSTVKDLINLTFSLERYTLIRDVSNLQKVGASHMLNKRGGISTEEYKSPKMAEIGKELLSSGKGIPTDYGLVFINEENPFNELYTGTTFPEYYYKNAYATVYLEKDDECECIYLPEDEAAIPKALRRLGCKSLDECSIHLEMSELDDSVIEGIFRSILDGEGLYRLNRFANRIEDCDDVRKLAAVMKYAEAEDSESLFQLARGIDHFIFIPDVTESEEVGRLWIERIDGLVYSPALEDYIDFTTYGEDMIDAHEGRFIESYGLVCMKEDMELSDVLENNGIGGMNL